MDVASGTPVELMKSAFRYRTALVAYAYGLLRDRSLAEDAVQDAFLVLLEKWEEFRPELGVFCWARKIVFYKVQELVRSRRKEIVVGDDELFGLVRQAVDERFTEEAAGRFDPRVRAYEECLGKLGRESTDLLMRYYRDEEPAEKIAGALRRSANAVWLSLSRIRKALRECISRRCGAAP